MDDDFNTAAASGFIFDLVRAINQVRSDGATAEQLEVAKEIFNELTDVLGLELKAQKQALSTADPFIDLLIELRGELRQQKDWALSDMLRDKLAQLGVTIEDSKDGTTWSWR